MAFFDITRFFQKQKHRQLLKERNLLHTLVNALPDLIYVKDSQGRYVLNNEAHLAFLGAANASDIAGKNVFDLFPPDLADKYGADDHQVLKTGIPAINDVVASKDSAGKSHWMSTSKVPLTDTSGKIIGLVGFARDITKSHQTEMSLRESEMRFRSVVQSAGDAIISADAHGKIFFWNKAAETLFGYSSTEAIGMPASVLFAEYEQLKVRRREVEFEVDGTEPRATSHVLELNCLKKDGIEFPVEVSLVGWKTDQGRFFTKTIRDITPRRQAQEALRAANETLERKVAERSAAAEQRTKELIESERAYRAQTTILQSILDSMGDGVVVVDAIGILVLCNPAAEELLGCTSSSMLGKPWSELYAPFMADEVTPIPLHDRPLARAMRGEAVDECELFLRSPNNPDGIWLSATARPQRDENGQPRGGVLVFHNITERKSVLCELNKAKEAAEAASRAKSEFLANMSHEIRTPMTAILGFADRMLAPNQILSDLQNWVQIIHRNGQHLLNLINDILDISKIEAGQLTTEKIICDLPQMLADIRSLMRPRALEKGLIFELLFDGPIPKTVVTDPVRMKQILVNLIGNAIKFTPGGRISLSVHCDQSDSSRTLKLSVSDTGIGMSKQQVAKLFQPFTQADESTTRRFGGTGLGLTISRQLANLLGGDVSVQSSLGTGSTFTAMIDVGPAQGVEMIQDLAESALPATINITGSRNMKFKGRILLAEDGRDNQRLLIEILRGAGAEVTLAENGRIALNLATSQSFDLILMDMQMPELDGYGATAELRRRGVKLPIIALTAHAMAEDRDKCLASGCDSYLTKPIDTESFLYIVGGYLNGTTIVQPAANKNTGNKMSSNTDRIQSTYAQLPTMKKIIVEFISELPQRVGDLHAQLAADNLDQLKRIAHQLRGAGGGYGFAELSDYANLIEQAVKEQKSLEQITELVDQLVEYMRRIDGYQIENERSIAIAQAA